MQFVRNTSLGNAIKNDAVFAEKLKKQYGDTRYNTILIRYDTPLVVDIPQLEETPPEDKSR